MENVLTASLFSVQQESSVSRPQSPPVPARKNQLRAEGKSYLGNCLESTLKNFKCEVIRDSQKVSKIVFV